MFPALFDNIGILKPSATSRLMVEGRSKGAGFDSYRQSSVGIYVASSGTGGIKNFTETTWVGDSSLRHADGTASYGPVFTHPALVSGSAYIGAMRVRATLTYNNGGSTLLGTFGSWIALGNVGTFSTTNWGIYDTLGGTSNRGAMEFTLEFALVGNEDVSRSFQFRCECNPETG